MPYKIRSVETINGPMDDLTKEESSPTLNQKLAILRTPRSGADDMAPANSRRLGSFLGVANRDRPFLGAPITEQSRVAMRGVGREGTEFFVIPTDTGSVCYLVGDIALGCMSQLVNELIGWNLTFFPDESGHAGDIAVHGLVANDVEAVQVVFKGRDGSLEAPVPAKVENNAFFAELQDTRVDPLAISEFKVQMKSGSVRSVLVRRVLR